MIYSAFEAVGIDSHNILDMSELAETQIKVADKLEEATGRTYEAVGEFADAETYINDVELGENQLLKDWATHTSIL